MVFTVKIRKLRPLIGLLAVFVLSAVPVEGGAQNDRAPVLGLPLDCQLGKTCWVVNHVDLDPGKAMLDYACTSFGYDGHKGTDIAIRDLKAMRDGVPVTASAAGVVIGIRDGVPDTGLAAPKRIIRGRECGNGVALAHKGGWHTQYCHMKNGSIVVRNGMKVARGQRLGSVGYSGNTQFPHVHITVRHNNRVIDPFLGIGPGQGCGQGVRSLWSPKIDNLLRRSPSAVYNAGFAAVRPPAKSVRAGLFKDKVLSRRAPLLLLWADVFWSQKGDVIQLQIFGPKGKKIHQYQGDVTKTKARSLYYAGMKRKALYWPSGVYRGEITLSRPNPSGPATAITAIRTVTLK